MYPSKFGKSSSQTREINIAELRRYKRDEWSTRWCSSFYSMCLQECTICALLRTSAQFDCWASNNQNQIVRVFFSNLSDITNFFNKSPQRIAILDETARKRIPHGSTIRWNFKSRTINIVYEYREQLIECMGKIESTSKQAVAINQGGAIRRMLEDLKFMFWLTVFHNIMPDVDVLYNQLQETRTDAALIRKQVNVFHQSLEKERKRMDTVAKEISASYETSRKRKRENIHINRTVASREICDIITNKVKERFCFISH
ncbi:hypothetical protein AVEN_144170-1 [Araneus ventricosus]|uniref:Uncharacterized protein n=1 Tax=Araneus ventricosus TaxID=182803 RepID=A0A4Y2GDH8_ARAVE|nr:hypothetical protein AVEN_144170-1 [Araneus ventricosus]